uniref:Uncharacterized protein n=1 Tax=Timema monikensis TaxID=170555 RepID=A0A7R9EGD2_9NEOP|nr:unnamed protein product [Timema monikensis]
MAENEERRHDDIPIYNYVGGNIVSFTEAENICLERILEIPSTKSIWYPWEMSFQSMFLYRLLAIFVHVIPAVLLDIALRMKGKPPMRNWGDDSTEEMLRESSMLVLQIYSSFLVSLLLVCARSAARLLQFVAVSARSQRAQRLGI